MRSTQWTQSGAASLRCSGSTVNGWRVLRAHRSKIFQSGAAAGLEWYRISGLRTLPTLFRLLRYTLSFLTKCLSTSRRVSTSLYLRRLRTCRRCPVYNRALHSCGNIQETFLNPATGKSEPIGCGCEIAVKAMSKEATCWLNVNGIDGGWDEDPKSEEYENRT